MLIKLGKNKTRPASTSGRRNDDFSNFLKNQKCLHLHFLLFCFLVLYNVCTVSEAAPFRFFDRKDIYLFLIWSQNPGLARPFELKGSKMDCFQKSFFAVQIQLPFTATKTHEEVILERIKPSVLDYNLTSRADYLHR
jgi:hypothetical protein